MLSSLTRSISQADGAKYLLLEILDLKSYSCIFYYSLIVVTCYTIPQADGANTFN